jgi:hypothetical protein
MAGDEAPPPQVGGAEEEEDQEDMDWSGEEVEKIVSETLDSLLSTESYSDQMVRIGVEKRLKR